MATIGEKRIGGVTTERRNVGIQGELLPGPWTPPPEGRTQRSLRRKPVNGGRTSCSAWTCTENQLAAGQIGEAQSLIKEAWTPEAVRGGCLIKAQRRCMPTPLLGCPTNVDRSNRRLLLRMSDLTPGELPWRPHEWGATRSSNRWFLTFRAPKEGRRAASYRKPSSSNQLLEPLNDLQTGLGPFQVILN